MGLPTALLTHGGPLRGLIYALVFLLPVNGSMNSFILIWSAILSSVSCFRMYSRIFSLLRPTVSTKYPLAQKCLSPYLYFKFACLSKIIRLLFPLRYPIICATLYLGGMLRSMWIWSGHASASMISTPFCSHNFLRICPISFLICPYITIRRYFGVNTT